MPPGSGVEGGGLYGKEFSIIIRHKQKSKGESMQRNEKRETSAPSGGTPEHLATYAPETCAGMRHIDKELMRINTSLELFCRKLGDVLPAISLEIYKTSQKATETMDSLTSVVPAGLIEITLNALEKHLNGVELQIRGNTAEDANFLERIRTLQMRLLDVPPCFVHMHDLALSLHTQLSGTPAGDDKHAEAAQLAGDLMQRSSKMLSDVRILITRSPAFAECLQRMEVIETAIIRDVRHHTRHGIGALKDTLNVIITIFKDLIDRANATKPPIQSIMTALQIHDIVRQDIENIRMALSVMCSPGGIGHPCSAVSFQGQACLASAILLDEIRTVVQDQSCLIDADIHAIQEIVSGVKNDNIHLSEFLLQNTRDESTIDTAMTEITVMMHTITDNLRELMDVTQQSLGHIHAIRETMRDLDAASLAAIETLITLAEITPSSAAVPLRGLRDVAETVRSEVVGLKACLPQDWFHKTHDVETLRQLATQLKKGEADIRGNLDEIKNLLVDSMEGINAYAHRCMGSIRRFKRRMERLQRLLKRISAIALELNGFGTVAGEIPVVSSAEKASAPEIADPGLIKILVALDRPHIRTLTEKPRPEDALLDDGLTLF